eukprot:391281-Hanusia_phi.AAC.1
MSDPTPSHRVSLLDLFSASKLSVDLFAPFICRLEIRVRRMTMELFLSLSLALSLPPSPSPSSPSPSLPRSLAPSPSPSLSLSLPHPLFHSLTHCLFSSTSHLFKLEFSARNFSTSATRRLSLSQPSHAPPFIAPSRAIRQRCHGDTLRRLDSCRHPSGKSLCKEANPSQSAASPTPISSLSAGPSARDKHVSVSDQGQLTSKPLACHAMLMPEGLRTCHCMTNLSSQSTTPTLSPWLQASLGTSFQCSPSLSLQAS